MLFSCENRSAEVLQTPSALLTNRPFTETDMANTELPSPEELRQLLRYDPKTGILYWRERGPERFTSVAGSGMSQKRWNASYADQPAGRMTPEGYIIINFGGKRMLAHRVAWAMCAGVWPTGCLDHINANRSDNRIENLREASIEQNAWHKRSRRGNSRFQGVCKPARSSKWWAYVGRKYLGSFDTEEEAAAARDAAATERWGRFANLNGA